MEANQQVIEQIQARVARAAAGFEAINGQCATHGGVPPYAFPESWAQSASLNTLVSMLAETGLLDLGAFLVRTLLTQAEVLENALGEAAEDFRLKTGIIVPLGLAGRPQG